MIRHSQYHRRTRMRHRHVLRNRECRSLIPQKSNSYQIQVEGDDKNGNYTELFERPGFSMSYSTYGLGSTLVTRIHDRSGAVRMSDPFQEQTDDYSLYMLTKKLF